MTGALANSLTGTFTSTTKPADTAEFQATKPRPGRTRLLWFTHPARKLAGAVTISGDSAGPYTVKLVPWAAVTGRVLDKDKKPRKGLIFNVRGSESPAMLDPDGFADWRGNVNTDGSFRVEGIVPGLTAQALIIDPEISFAHMGAKLSFKPGATIDIGEFITPVVELPAEIKNRLRPPPPPAPKPLTTVKFDESKGKAQYRADFSHEQYDIHWLRIDGPAGTTRLVTPDKKGLRFKVPAGVTEGATLHTKFRIAGDFEVTAAFEAVSTVHPTTGWGMGPELLIKPPGGWESFASAGRFLRTGPTVYSLVHRYKAGDQTKYNAVAVPTSAKIGRFRIVRTGPMLHFQAAEGESSAFRELMMTEFGSGPVEFVRLAAVNGGSQKPVEVLWKDLTIRAEELPGFTGSSSNSSPQSSRFVLAALGVGLVAGIGAIVWWRTAARKSNGRRQGASPRSGRVMPDKAHALSQAAHRPAKVLDVSAAWDETTLAKIEEAAAGYAQTHPKATSCGQRPRFQFSLQEGMLHGSFVAWKPVPRNELDALGASWDQIREKLPLLFQGTYHQGKRQGIFSYYSDDGQVSTRSYQDGCVAG